MRLIPKLDLQIHRFDRWQLLGMLFDRPLVEEESTRVKRASWYKGLVKRPASSRRLFSRRP